MEDLTHKMVKIRFKRNFVEQALWVFIGKVLKFEENWIEVEGRGIVIDKGKVSATAPVDIDEEVRPLIIPRDNIAHMRVLPDDFNINNIQFYRKGFRYYIKVDNAPDASLGEMGETV